VIENGDDSISARWKHAMSPDDTLQILSACRICQEMQVADCLATKLIVKHWLNLLRCPQWQMIGHPGFYVLWLLIRLSSSIQAQVFSDIPFCAHNWSLLAHLQMCSRPSIQAQMFSDTHSCAHNWSLIAQLQMCSRPCIQTQMFSDTIGHWWHNYNAYYWSSPEREGCLIFLYARVFSVLLIICPLDVGGDKSNIKSNTPWHTSQYCPQAKWRPNPEGSVCVSLIFVCVSAWKLLFIQAAYTTHNGKDNNYRLWFIQK